MKMREAQAILDGAIEPELQGYIVYFWWEYGEILGKMRPSAAAVSDWFPDYEAGEPPLDLEIAETYCRRFGEKLGQQVKPEVRALHFSSIEGFTTKAVKSDNGR